MRGASAVAGGLIPCGMRVALRRVLHARLLRRVFRVSLEPQGIRAEVDLARPFETAATFAHVHLRKDGRIGQRRKHTPAYEVIEAAHRGRSVCPDEGDAGVRGSGIASVMTLSDTRGIAKSSPAPALPGT